MIFKYIITRPANGGYEHFVTSGTECYVLAYGIAKPVVMYILSGAGQKIQENAAMLAGMCLFTGFNYIGQRMFAFKE